MDRRIQFTKIRDVKSPARANANDAGTDFFILMTICYYVYWMKND